MPERLRAAIYLAAYGGLRLSEWRALRRRDLNLAADGRYVVSVVRQAYRDETEAGGWHVGPLKSHAADADDGARAQTLPAWLLPIIENHLFEHVGQFPDDLLFPSGGEAPFIETAWRNPWKRARIATGLYGVVREHDLRHFYGTNLAAAGATAPQLQAALGHATIPMAMQYVKAARGASAEVADLLSPPSTAPSKVVPINRRRKTAM